MFLLLNVFVLAPAAAAYLAFSISGNQSAKEKPLKCLQADIGAELNAMLHFILNRAFKGEL